MDNNVGMAPRYEHEIPEGYEAALERCKQWVAGTSGLNPGASPKEVAEYLFPELAESEDERIRKMIIEQMERWKKAAEEEGVEQDVNDATSAIAYLERQKEQKEVFDADKFFVGKDVTDFKSEIFLVIRGARELKPTDEEIWLNIENQIAPNLIDILQKEQKSVQDKEEREYVRTLKSLIADFLRGKDEVDRGYYQDIYDWLDGRHIEQKPINECNTHELTLDESRKWNEAYEKGYSLGYENGRNEQKPAINIEHLKSYMLQYLQDASNRKNDSEIEADTDKWAEMIIKVFGSIEQKPIEDKNAVEKPPKQDYSGLTDFERAIHRGFLCAGVENVPVEIIKDTAQDCLAHIKPAEWSDEDEKIIDGICGNLEYLLHNNICAEQTKVNLENRIKWLLRLKSLRPSWKPSEEQMEALMLAIEGKWEEILLTGYMSRRLEDLYEGLANTFKVECKLDE